MMNIDYNVYNALSDVAKTHLGYSKEWNEFPHITYLCTDNSVARKSDGEEYLTHFVYKVDLYCDAMDNCMNLCELLDDAMCNLGFKRESMQYLQEEYIHFLFYYSAYVDKNGYVFQSI